MYIEIIILYKTKLTFHNFCQIKNGLSEKYYVSIHTSFKFTSRQCQKILGEAMRLDEDVLGAHGAKEII